MSLYDRVAAVSEALKALGLFSLENQLNGVCDELMTIEDVLERIEQQHHLEPIKNVRRQVYDY